MAVDAPHPISLLTEARGSGQFEVELEQEYHHRKFDELRRYTWRTVVTLPPLILGLWIWDRVIDPAAAPQTLVLRIGMSVCLLPLIIALRWSRIGLNAFTILLYTCALATEFFWLRILLRLEGGLVYGIGGYMFYVLGLLVISLPLRFRDSLIGMLIVMLAPDAAAALGLVPGFLYAKYNTLILPACGLSLITIWAFDRLYRRTFAYQRSVERLAAEDVLTGLANRRYFMIAGGQLLERVKRYERPACLLLLDLDHFKAVNDRYGHQAGDVVLQVTARLLTEHRRSADVPARIGGEEFAVLLPETDLPGAVTLAERLRAGLPAAPIPLTGNPGATVTMTMSIGVTVCRGTDGSLSDVLRRADAALYRAKTAGRNRVVTA